MSYEYKDYFKELHFNEARKVGSDLNDRFNARDELNEVYSQAAKADEYEAKAKAFEKVAGIAYWYFERVNPKYADFSDYEGFYDDIKDEFKRLESGESE